jgi:guanylate kinase
MKKGLLVIVSSPSGGGKDTVINALLLQLQNAARLVTTTTRAPRIGEKDGMPYFFITPKIFKEKIAAHEFVEYNEYAGNYYGTEKTVLDAALKKNAIVFSNIEVTGKHNFDKLKIPHLSFFLLPDNTNVLRERLERRGGMQETAIVERLRLADEEIAASGDYQYRIVNASGKLSETVSYIAKIITNHLVV